MRFARKHRAIHHEQVLDIPGEPLHVGTNGGGRKIEEIATLDSSRELVVSQRGFTLVSLDQEQMIVELFNAGGDRTHTRTSHIPVIF